MVLSLSLSSSWMWHHSNQMSKRSHVAWVALPWGCFPNGDVPNTLLQTPNPLSPVIASTSTYPPDWVSQWGLPEDVLVKCPFHHQCLCVSFRVFTPHHCATQSYQMQCRRNGIGGSTCSRHVGFTLVIDGLRGVTRITQMQRGDLLTLSFPLGEDAKE